MVRCFSNQHASSHIVCKYFIVQYCTKSVISLEAMVFLNSDSILEQDVKETFSSWKLNTFMFSAKVLHQPNGFSEPTSKSFHVAEVSGVPDAVAFREAACMKFYLQTRPLLSTI